jgi:outer membrane lipoprotein SlyB
MRCFKVGLAGPLSAALALGGCVGPTGPSPQMVPPPDSSAAASADQACRQYADAQIAPLRDQANASTVGSTLLGAGLGAAIGAAAGGGRGAAIGAASGGALGLGAGAANAQGAAVNLQQQYDVYYANCMAARNGPPPGYAPPPGGGAGPPSGYGPPPGYEQPPPGYAPPPGAAYPPPGAGPPHP